MKIGITIPVYLTNSEHKRYLDLCTRSLISANHDLIFIPVENYLDSSLVPVIYEFSQNPEKIYKIYPTGQQSVSKAWNLGIEAGKNLGCEYILVINSDIVLKSNAIDRLVAFAHDDSRHDPLNVEVMWTMAEYTDLGSLEEAFEDENYSEHPHFSCFMVRNTFFDNIGKFDENFVPAYCEDGDMHARIALNKYKAYVYGGARFFHFGSRTIKSDRELWNSNSQTFPKNQEYFLKKWGHPPVGEPDDMRKLYYKTPFNDPNKSLKEW